MDKFAVLQLKKKKAREEELRLKGIQDGDKYAPSVMTDAERDKLNISFGYPAEPTGAYCVSKFTPPDQYSAAVWWTWEGVWRDFKKDAEVAAALEAEKAAEEARLAAEAVAALSQKSSKNASLSRKSSIMGMFGSGSQKEEAPMLEDEDAEEDIDWSTMSLKSKRLKEKKVKLTKEEKKAAAAVAAEAERIRLEAEAAAREEAYIKSVEEAAERAKALIGWEVSRYKRESPGHSSSGEEGGWKLKGTLFIDAIVENGRLKMQTVVSELGENCEYRFVVRAVNGRGKGGPSPPSNSIMIEKELPSGWFRFYHEELGRQYYANIKTGQTSWSRPDFDRYFLDETVVLTFSKDELRYLREIFAEEYEHFRAVLRERFADILREVGERMSAFRVFKLFKGYAKDEYQIASFQEFMDIMMHIKKKKMAMSMEGMAQAGNNAKLLMRRQLASTLLTKTDKQKYKNWVIEYSNIAEKEYYVNTLTKVKQWDMPDDIRFYLPPKLEHKMLTSFDFGHMEVFKQYFSMLDVDSSGDLSDKELRMLLDALNIDIDDDKFRTLVLTVDLNGNGTIEFDEFCWMMYELARTDRKGALSGMVDLGTLDGLASGEGGLNMDLQQVSTNLAALKAKSMRGAMVDVTVTPRGEIKPAPPSSSTAVSDAPSGAAQPAGASAKIRSKEKPASPTRAANSDQVVVANSEASEGKDANGETDEGIQENKGGEEEEEDWVDDVVEEDGGSNADQKSSAEATNAPPLAPSLPSRLLKWIYAVLHPNAIAAAQAERAAKAAAAKEKADRIAERQRKNRERDQNSAHGPYCMCGCRAF